MSCRSLKSKSRSLPAARALLAAQARDEELELHTQVGLNHGLTRVEIEEILVEEGSRVAGVSIGDSKVHERMGVIILAIKRGGAAMRFNPSAADRIQADVDRGDGVATTTDGDVALVHDDED